MALQTRMLGEGFAVEILDIDLAEIDDATLAEVRAQWMAHKVAILRDQTLSDDALVEARRVDARGLVLLAHARWRRGGAPSATGNVARPDGASAMARGRAMGDVGSGRGR